MNFSLLVAAALLAALTGSSADRNLQRGKRQDHKMCLPGHQLSEDSDRMCEPCSAGTHREIAVNSKCQKCPPGSYSGAGAAACSKCWPGSFAASSGSASCQKCAKGSIAATDGLSSCTPCPAGSFVSFSGSPACVKCPAGTSSKAGAEECSKCQPGHFSPAGAAACRPCPAGRVSAAGASACHRCPAGSFSVAGASACHRCPAGKFSARGASICTRCPAGSFSAMGASACTRCPAGSFSAMGASACTLCPAGQFASSEGSKQCKACPPGTFSDAAGAAECQKCDRDFALAIKSGMTKCDLCPNGGAALRDNRCYRKLKVSCRVSWPDCERTIDNDVYSYGQALHKKFAKPSTPVHETYFHYKFDAPVNLRGFAVWGKYGCCLKSIRNFKIVASTEGQTHSCFFDGKYDVGKFEFSNYSGTHRNCKYDSVTDLKIEHRYNDAANKIITIAEVAFYAY
ncbi:hypothetical protein BOX15_Mlig024117g1 [Macrostomum lignano]|uniref:Tyrosine-protein kinase ephrin type A/B receptor-like domain-containing protein n=1 Tax=Macrostomum lignano TaxID=282301 RepID=A0A267F8Z8_9PLAT|nr:hypothetical protein BOX15_Mlig024117g1 [Macrostomum lignano]